MKYRVFATLLVCLIMVWASPAQERSGMDSQFPKLTGDRAIAAVRLKVHDAQTSFQIVREVEPSTQTQEVAQLSFRESSSQHVTIYGDGIYLDLLKNGGFLILQVDSETRNATGLHLVSSRDDGRYIVQSHKIEDRVDPALVGELTHHTAEFVRDLLNSPPSAILKLQSRFYGGNFPVYDSPQEQSFFSIPRTVQRIKLASDEPRELATLIGAFQLWPIRFAISMPIYAANPNRALELARQKHKDLVARFLQENNRNPEFVYDLQDLESIRSGEQLTDRVAWFRRLDDFLDQAYQRLCDSNTFSVNSSISTIALEFGAAGHRQEGSYAVMTSPGLIVVWRRLQTGGFAVAEVSLAE
jgi:hypothetical protein